MPDTIVATMLGSGSNTVAIATITDTTSIDGAIIIVITAMRSRIGTTIMMVIMTAITIVITIRIGTVIGITNMIVATTTTTTTTTTTIESRPSLEIAKPRRLSPRLFCLGSRSKHLAGSGRPAMLGAETADNHTEIDA